MKKTKRKRGEINLSGLPNSALYIGMGVFVVALVVSILAQYSTSECTRLGGSEGTWNSSPSQGTAPTNPLSGNYLGCCSYINTSNPQGTRLNVCETWAQSGALNTSYRGTLGLGTFNNFWSVLVLIVVLAIVIGALYAVFPRRAGY